MSEAMPIVIESREEPSEMPKITFFVLRIMVGGKPKLRYINPLAIEEIAPEGKSRCYLHMGDGRALEALGSLEEVCKLLGIEVRGLKGGDVVQMRGEEP